MARESRNTTTERRCPECQGTGSVTVNDTNPFGYGPDPQCDEDVPCPNRNCLDGWIRWASSDPLTILAAERRGLLQLKSGNPIFRASAIRYYNRAKAAAFKPVPLPRSLGDLYANLQTALAEYRGRDAVATYDALERAA